jgi:hypothetical protein
MSCQLSIPDAHLALMLVAPPVCASAASIFCRFPPNYQHASVRRRESLHQHRSSNFGRCRVELNWRASCSQKALAQAVRFVGVRANIYARTCVCPDLGNFARRMELDCFIMDEQLPADVQVWVCCRRQHILLLACLRLCVVCVRAAFSPSSWPKLRGLHCRSFLYSICKRHAHEFPAVFSARTQTRARARVRSCVVRKVLSPIRHYYGGVCMYMSCVCVLHVCESVFACICLWCFVTFCRAVR